MRARPAHSEDLAGVLLRIGHVDIVSKAKDIVKRQLLLQESVERVNHKRVARLMRSAGWVGISRRKGFRTTVRDRDARPAPDRVQRCFTAERPPYVPTLAGFLFLAVVLDMFSRRIVGWAMAHLRTELILGSTWRSTSGGRRT